MVIARPRHAPEKQASEATYCGIQQKKLSRTIITRDNWAVDRREAQPPNKFPARPAVKSDPDISHLRSRRCRLPARHGQAESTSAVRGPLRGGDTSAKDDGMGQVRRAAPGGPRPWIGNLGRCGQQFRAQHAFMMPARNPFAAIPETSGL